MSSGRRPRWCSARPASSAVPSARRCTPPAGRSPVWCAATEPTPWPTRRLELVGATGGELFATLAELRPTLVVNAAGRAWPGRRGADRGKRRTGRAGRHGARRAARSPARLVHLGSAHEYGASPGRATGRAPAGPRPPRTGGPSSPGHGWCAPGRAQGRVDGVVLRLSRRAGPASRSSAGPARRPRPPPRAARARRAAPAAAAGGPRPRRRRDVADAVLPRGGPAERRAGRQRGAAWRCGHRRGGRALRFAGSTAQRAPGPPRRGPPRRPVPPRHRRRLAVPGLLARAGACWACATAGTPSTTPCASCSPRHCRRSTPGPAHHRDLDRRRTAHEGIRP